MIYFLSQPRTRALGNLPSKGCWNQWRDTNDASPAGEADAPASVGAEEADVVQEKVAEEVVGIIEAACDSNENAAAEADTDYTCDLCETTFQFQSFKDSQR